MKKLVNKLVTFILIMVFIISLNPSEVQASVKKATSVNLNETSLTLSVGDADILTASILPAGVTNKTLSWSSSDTKIATVTKKGKVKAVAPGDATITVKTSNGKKATCDITVVGFLDRMLYSSYTSDLKGNTYSLYEGNDYNGDKCQRAMKFYMDVYRGDYSEEVAKAGITKSAVIYDLDGKYDVFTCELTHGVIETNASIKILGDGKVLYLATWTNETQSMDMDLDIKGVQELSIEIESSFGGWNSNTIIFTNAKFEKE